MTRLPKTEQMPTRARTPINPASLSNRYYPEDTPMLENSSQVDRKNIRLGLAENYPTPQSPIVTEPENEIENLGHQLRERVKAITSIADLGLEAELDLPKVVVVGDQSAGKSSLIEAISGISVPRSGGTCTRCPIQINLQTGDGGETGWTAKVELVLSYSYLPEQHSDPNVNIGPWRRNDQAAIIEFAHLHQQRTLAHTIERAQMAILNPAKNPASFLNSQLRMDLQVDFSPNVVRLTLVAPHLPNLSLYDLPGIINRVERRDDRYTVELIRVLASHYINQRNTIVILCLAMNNDPQNSTAATLVTNGEAENRSLGVLTKPDQLPETDRDGAWLDIFKGSSLLPLRHGFFVTKQPSQEQLDQGITHAEARIIEEKYFRHSKRWSDGFHQYKNRQGTTNLQHELSKLLAQEISKSLPRVDRIVATELHKKQMQLKEYPAPAQNTLTTIIHFVEKFRSELSLKMQGDTDNGFIRKWRELMLQYRHDLFSLKPMVVVRSGMEPGWRAIVTPNASRLEPISIDDDEDEVPSPSAFRKRPLPSSSPAVPAKRVRSSQDSTPSLTPQKFTLDQVRQIIHDAWMGGIPNSNDPRADTILMKKSMVNWCDPLESLENQMSNTLRKEVKDILDELLVPYSSTLLCAEAREGVSKRLEDIIWKHHVNATDFANAEQLKHTTFNDEMLDMQRKKEFDLLAEKRRKWRIGAFYEYQEQMLGKRTTVSDLDKKLGEDPFAAELHTMARVRGYFNIASMTMVDTIGKLIHLQLFVRCRDELADALHDHLKLNDRNSIEHCDRLLTQDEGRRREREKILSEIEKLERARQMLQQLKTSE